MNKHTLSALLLLITNMLCGRQTEAWNCQNVDLLILKSYERSDQKWLISVIIAAYRQIRIGRYRYGM